MKKQYKLGIIGCGEIATVLMRGAIESDFLRPKKIIVSDISEEQLDKVDYLGVHSTNSNAYVAENSEFLVLAVKAQDFPAVASSLKNVWHDKVISLSSGLKKADIKNALGQSYAVRVARFEMNFPCTVGDGVIGADMSDFNSLHDDCDFFSNLFSNLGTIISVDEGKLNAISVLSDATLPYLFMDSLVEEGVKLGLTRAEAKIVAANSLYGSSSVALNSEDTLIELLKKSSRATCGLEAVKAFESGGFSKIVADAVAACLSKQENTK